MHLPDQTTAPEKWDLAYEVKAVGLLSFGFGLVGLDRFIIYPLFPVMSKDLGLSYQDLGLISGVLALSWGLASILAGRLSDRIGLKRVLIPAVFIFSALVATTGLATGLVSLLVIRALMGLAEGAYVPASIVATVQVSKPGRIGLNVGIQQMSAALFGLGLGPIVAVALLKVLPSWHWVFAVVAVPGLLVGWLLNRTLRVDASVRASAEGMLASPQSRFLDVFRFRSVTVNTLCMCCWLTSLIVLSAFMPSYLTDHLKLGLDQMGLVLSGMGLGSFIGMVMVSALSDRFGCKPIMIVALAVELVALWALPQLGADPWRLFAILSVVAFMNAGVIAITVGPLTSRGVPARLAATATGIVIGCGELMGGAVAPAVAGGLAQAFGIAIVIDIAIWAIAAGLVVVVIGIRESERRSTFSSLPEGRA